MNDAPPSHVSYPEVGHEFCFAAEERSFWFAHRNRVILAAIARHHRGGEILDVGAGNGFVTSALERAGFDAVAIEPGEDGCANARTRGVRRVVCASLENAGISAHSAGGIGLFDVVEHLENDTSFLASLPRYLKPGGCIYLTVPAHRALWSSEDVFAGHFRRYSLGAITRACSDAGLKIEFASYFFSLLPPAIFLVRVLPERLGLAKPRSEPSSVRQHDLGGSGLRRVAEKIFAPEGSLIARGRSIPFGASCIVVASA